MKVSASIVTFRTDTDELTQCLQCLMRSGVTDIWIIDNSPESTDVEATVAPRLTFADVKLRYRHLPHNPGYGSAHNLAILEAEAESFEAHLVVNTDIKFDETAVKTLIAVLEADDNIGQISPRIVSPDGQPQFAQRLLPTPLDVFGRRFLPSFMMRGRNRRYMLKERDDIPANIPYHQGSFILFRMKALHDVGGFDQRYFMYPEDIDITRRVRQLTPPCIIRRSRSFTTIAPPVTAICECCGYIAAT